MDKRTIILKAICGVVAVAAAVLLLCGVFNKGNDARYHIGALTRQDINYVTVEAPSASSKDGTVTAKDWQSLFPYITMTMWSTKDNSGQPDYLQQDPYLKNLYEGYGFAKDYKAARGHEYTLQDVMETQRTGENSLANCLTCKTPNFAKMVQDMGVGVYKENFQEVWQKIHDEGEAISCFTCHGNSAGNKGELEVTHTYVNKALGANIGEIDPATLSCGQCHIEYYFTVEEAETMMPYSGREGMTAQQILAYYDSIPGKDGTLGFYDWIQEDSTGAKMLKAQHPEMETFLQGVHAQQKIGDRTMNCADCHMPVTLGEDGTVYHNHALVNPLENKDALAVCASCHGDANMVEAVHRIQKQITERESKVGNQLSDLKDALTAAVKAGSLKEEQLNQARKLYREAQWFFDYSYVENSEGFHGWSAPKDGKATDVSNTCLDLAEVKIAEAMALLGR